MTAPDAPLPAPTQQDRREAILALFKWENEVSDEAVKPIAEAIARARQMITALCKPRGSEGAREWVMSIPANRERDPDLVISDAIRALEAALAEAQRRADGLENELETRLLEAIDAAGDRR